ncbi:MAG: FAD-binding protein, partial [Candidatus Moranbacteria bacterium]|nr:FAD-binding protein [Candidatus Moranbacteria bacterium]
MKIQEKVLLKDYSTFKIGGPAKYFTEVKDLKELKDSIKWARKEKEKFMILGGGSNILFHDEGFNGLVIKLVNDKIKLVDETTVSCEAGVMLGGLVSFSIENNLAGLEWAAGIPGTVGGAIRGNAGAFGSEMKNVVEEVAYFNLESLKEEKCSSEKCQFDYRQSVFKEFDHKII